VRGRRRLRRGTRGRNGRGEQEAGQQHGEGTGNAAAAGYSTPRIARSTTVRIAETSNEPTQPRRFEKNRKMETSSVKSW
jgi:hypothetical protein